MKTDEKTDGLITILGDPRNPPPPKKQTDVGQVIAHLPMRNQDDLARQSDPEIGKTLL